MADDGVDESKRSTLRRFAALGAASGLASSSADARESTDPAASPDVREAIVGYLDRTPGAHFSKLRDDLQLGTGESQHHLRRLEEAGAVESVRDGDYRRFYPAGRFSAFERTALGYLRRETPRGLVIALLRDPSLSGADLATALGVSPATVSRWAGDLAAAGLLDRSSGYALERPETLLVLLVRYADSFGPRTRALVAEADDLVVYDP
jgi:predicted transcriptional regulator